MAGEKRRIPKKDKAKRSLYMSAQTIKNLPKGKRIDWEGDKSPSGSGESYQYVQSGRAVMGKKKKEIRTPSGDRVTVDIDKHMSDPNKKGGSDTYRRKVKGKHRTLKGAGSNFSDTKSTVDTTYTKTTRGGKVLKKENIRESEDSMKNIMKEVADEVKRKPKRKKEEVEAQKIIYDYIPSKKDRENFSGNKKAKKQKKGWRLPTDKEKKEYKDSIPKYKKMYGGWLKD